MPCATPGSSWLGNQWVLVTVMPEPVALDRQLGDLERVVGADGRRVHEREVREVEEVVEHETGADPGPGGDEMVVQEAVGVCVREVEPLPHRFVGREEHQAAELGEPRRAPRRAHAAGCGRCRRWRG